MDSRLEKFVNDECNFEVMFIWDEYIHVDEDIQSVYCEWCQRTLGTMHDSWKEKFDNAHDHLLEEHCKEE